MSDVSSAAYRPENLTDEHELAQPVHDEPLWSENYLTQVYSPANEVGVYMHFNRPPFNANLWHDIFVAYLPGDEFLVAKGFHPEEPVTRGPRGAGLDWTCDEPWVQWTKRFQGAVRHVSGEELRSGPLRDGISIGASMELTCRGLSPAFGVGDLGEQDWAVDHYEQHCSFTGRLSYGDTTLELEGTGLRDHSWGPRDLSRMAGHAWLHGQFPDGRSFMVIYVENKSGTGHLDHSVIGDGDHFEPVELLEAPVIREDSQPLDPYVLRLRREDGRIEEISAQPLQAAPIALVGPSEMAYGLDDRPDCHHMLYECQARFEWDGEVGYGLSERSVER